MCSQRLTLRSARIGLELNSTTENRNMIQGGGAQLTSFDPENVKCDLYDRKKRDVTDAGPQLTSMLEKTSRH